MRWFDKIWHIQGSLPLAPGLSDEDVFDRLDPLFQQSGTTFQRDGETLTFSKKDQAAQDKMSIFDGGTLRIDVEDAKPVLAYCLKSRALLTCFFAPLVFLAFAQFAVALNALHNGSAAADRAAVEKDAADDDEEEEVIRLHPIDRFLGAPQPKQPGDDEEESEERDASRADADKDDEKEPQHSPGPAYVFAGIFALIYLVGRFLEDWLIKRRFQRFLDTEPTASSAE